MGLAFDIKWRTVKDNADVRDAIHSLVGM